MSLYKNPNIFNEINFIEIKANNNNDTIVVLGGGLEQIEVIERCHKEGFKIIVIDKNINCAANNLGYIEFMNKSIYDTNEIFIQLKKKEKEFKIIAILCIGVDSTFSYLKLKDKYCKRPGHSKEFLKKNIYSNKFQQYLLFKSDEEFSKFVPKTKLIKQVDSEILNFSEKDKVVVKPVGGRGSIGVKICKNNLDDIQKSVNYSLKQSDNQEIIIQEYIEGEQFSAEGIIINGEPFLYMVTSRIYDWDKASNVVEQGGDLPFIPLDKNYKIFVDFFSKVSKIFGIKNGPLKLDLVLDKSIGKLKLIEAAARLGGGFVSTISAPVCTNIDILGLIINLELGKDISKKYIKHDIQQKNYFKKFGSLRFLMPEQIKNKSGIAININKIDFEKYDCMFATFNNEALKNNQKLSTKNSDRIFGCFSFSKESKSSKANSELLISDIINGKYDYDYD